MLPLLAGPARGGDRSRGWLDALGDNGPPPSTGRAQDLMLGRAVPLVYERWWRPFWGRLALGVSPADEHRLARLLLDLGPGDGVLDLACGPGNFTRVFAQAVGDDGLAVGVDASATMLDRAVAADPDGRAAYVRADARHLPFVDRSFDAVCCFLALHLMADPLRVLDEVVRVLTPGGRVGILATCGLRSAPGRLVTGAAGAGAGIRVFGRDELVEALEDRGVGRVHQRVQGLLQVVGGTVGI
jgi:SAM-dependent methyltransferase